MNWTKICIQAIAFVLVLIVWFRFVRIVVDLGQQYDV